MDREGIGTDATIASHIKKIQDRCYSVKNGTYFQPTEFGLALINGYCLISRESGCVVALLCLLHSLHWSDHLDFRIVAVLIAFEGASPNLTCGHIWRLIAKRLFQEQKMRAP